jgi:hypothetical protein
MPSGNITPGIGGTGLRFDGSDDYINVKDAVSLKLGNYTLSAWVSTTDSGGDLRIINKEETPGPEGATRDFGLLLRGDLGAWAFIDYNSLVTNSVNSGEALNDGLWHFLTAVREANRLVLYVDGIEVGVNDTLFTDVLDNIADLRIGAKNNDTQFFNGMIDEVRIANSARRDSWIKLEYENQRTDSRMVIIE